MHSESVKAEFLEEQAHADAIAARITTRKMLEGRLAPEEEHAEDMAALLKQI